MTDGPTFGCFMAFVDTQSGRRLYRGRLPVAAGDFQLLRSRGVTKAVNFESGIRELVTRTVNDEVFQGRYAGIDVASIRFSPVFPPSLRDLDLAVDVLKALLVEGSVYFHCRRGKERTGMVAAAWRIRECGWTLERARNEMRMHGFSLLFSWWLPRLAAYPKYIAERSA